MVVAFGFVLLGASRLSEARGGSGSGDGSVAARGAYALLVFLGAAFCLAALVLGFVAMTKK